MTRRIAKLASIVFSLVLVGAVMFGTITAAQATPPPLPSTTPSNTGMVDFPGASGDPNTIAVRTITQAGNDIWTGGIFDEIDDANGNKVAPASGLAAFDATTGAMATGVAIPTITLSTGTPEVYGTALGPNGILYFTGAFDAVNGQTRHNVAAIDAQTGALQPFAPNGAAVGNAILATPDAIYVGTGKLLSYQLNGSATPGYSPPQVFIDASLRGHVTIPAFRSITKLGNTVVSACQCDSLTDANGTRFVKAIVEINATTGAQNSWVPLDPVINPTTPTGQQADAWGIDAIVHNAPGTNTPVIYLAAGGSDFAEAFDFSSGAKVWKTDCSGSCQAVTWYQGNLIYGGHFEWTASPSTVQCGNNENPVTTCYYTPKLAAMSASTGTVLLNGGRAAMEPRHLLSLRRGLVCPDRQRRLHALRRGRVRRRGGHVDVQDVRRLLSVGQGPAGELRGLPRLRLGIPDPDRHNGRLGVGHGERSLGRYQLRAVVHDRLRDERERHPHGDAATWDHVHRLVQRRSRHQLPRRRNLHRDDVPDARRHGDLRPHQLSAHRLEGG